MIQCHKSLVNKNDKKKNTPRDTKKQGNTTKNKYARYVGEYVKNIKLGDIDEDWTRVSKAVKEIAMEHVRKIKGTKKKWHMKTADKQQKKGG